MGMGLVTIVGQKERPLLKKNLKPGACEVVPIGVLREGTGKVILRYE
jgi:hypothetical protein